MCGYVAALSKQGIKVDPQLISSMVGTLWRRGPDDHGFYSRGPVALGFRRLRIIDPSYGGHQPFSDATGDLAIVFNGEIYNFVELRSELAGKGHKFRSESDTEVLLAAYAEWGTECLSRLNGMWSFIIVDHRNSLVFGARDRFGIKPMYRVSSEGTTFFASEIKALKRALPTKPSVNWRYSTRFLAEGNLGAVYLPGETFFEEITEVLPATAFTITYQGEEKSWRYWQLPSELEDFGDSTSDLFRELIEDSVRMQLRSDVPVGVALSGGLDSSTIIGIMARMVGSASGRSMHGLHAFSYMEKEYDEEEYISETVRQTGATLHQISPKPSEIWKLLPGVLAAHDEPLYSASALASNQVYALAARAGIKVVLGGQGADEVLGGYPSYFSEMWLDLLRSRKIGRVVSEVRDFGNAHGRPSAPLFRNLLYRLLATSKSIPRPHRRAQMPYETFLSRDLVEHSRSTETKDIGNGLRNILVSSVEQNSLPLFLRMEDRNSMAHSIEARLPFLDHRLVTFAFRLANEWKMRGRWNKYVLRESMRNVIPENVRTRVDKMGFPTGFSRWIRAELRQDVDVALTRVASEHSHVFNVKSVRKAFEAHLRGDADHSAAIFHVIQFSEWLRQQEESSNSDNLAQRAGGTVIRLIAGAAPLLAAISA